jgi:hypothetical protein
MSALANNAPRLTDKLTTINSMNLEKGSRCSFVPAS